jgi:hypothetical protein
MKIASNELAVISCCGYSLYGHVDGGNLRVYLGDVLPLAVMQEPYPVPICPPWSISAIVRIEES